MSERESWAWSEMVCVCVWSEIGTPNGGGICIYIYCADASVRVRIYGACWVRTSACRTCAAVCGASASVSAR